MYAQAARRNSLAGLQARARLHCTDGSQQTIEEGHFRLYAPQQKPDLFNHLVGALDLLRSP